MSRQPAYVPALLKQEAYVNEGFAPAAVELVETHVSYLFLTGEFVYKVKKAVDLGFLDFRSLETRKYFCEEELRVNGRFSPSVYLAVLPVAQNGERITIGGPGEAIDYAIKMRQLPRERMLGARLRAGAVTREDIVRIARRVAEVHEKAERMSDPAGPGTWQSFKDHVEENVAQTERAAGQLASGAALEDIATYSRAFLEARRGLFNRRQAEGRVVDGHGDLHADQICLMNGVEFIDALEFSPAYRYGDVAADLAFLAMDLDHFGRRDLSRVLMDAYQKASGDKGLAALMDFFKCYRAHVRAKVTMLKLDSPDLAPEERGKTEAEAKAYFELARSYALSVLPTPALYLVMGLPGTGKSTVAQDLAERWGVAMYSSDIERKRLMGMDPSQRAAARPGKGIYRSQVGRRTYARLMDLAVAELKVRRSVVLDATFTDPKYREQAADLAGSLGAGLWLIECTLAEEEVRQRIGERVAAGAGPSDASFEIYELQRRAWTPVKGALSARHLQLDTGAAPREVMQRLVSKLLQRAVRATSSAASSPGRSSP